MEKKQRLVFFLLPGKDSRSSGPSCVFFPCISLPGPVRTRLVIQRTTHTMSSGGSSTTLPWKSIKRSVLQHLICGKELEPLLCQTKLSSTPTTPQPERRTTHVCQLSVASDLVLRAGHVPVIYQMTSAAPRVLYMGILWDMTGAGGGGCSSVDTGSYDLYVEPALRVICGTHEDCKAYLRGAIPPPGSARWSIMSPQEIIYGLERWLAAITMSIQFNCRALHRWGDLWESVRARRAMGEPAPQYSDRLFSTVLPHIKPCAPYIHILVCAAAYLCDLVQRSQSDLIRRLYRADPPGILRIPRCVDSIPRFTDTGVFVVPASLTISCPAPTPAQIEEAARVIRRAKRKQPDSGDLREDALAAAAIASERAAASNAIRTNDTGDPR